MTITYERVKELFDYHPDGYLIWKIKIAPRIRIGDRAGTSNNYDYGVVSISQKLLKTHRIVFLWHHGYMPNIVDHIDGNIFNNKIENLREATLVENSRNSKVNTKNTSGVKGVSYEKKINKWRAYIGINGKVKVLGSFKNFEDAVKVRENAEKETFKNFARVRLL